MKNLWKAMEDAGSGVLCTVLEKQGSAPRGPGAAMAVLPDGKTVGTIGGGILEYEAIQTALEYGKTKSGGVREFVLDNTQAGSLGMVCGGRVKVEFRYLEGEALVQAASEDRQDPKVWVFGGGHVSQALVPVLLGLDFAVTVLEERPEFADPALFPGAETKLVRYEELSDLPLGAEDYVVVLTRGHQGDYDVVKQLLSRAPFYLGCIGSRRKAALTRERLLSDGFSTETVEKLHSPIGLPIHAETPAEIAVSIAAEMIACRRNA